MAPAAASGSVPSAIERPTFTAFKPAVDTRPLLQRVHWMHVILLSVTPVVALYGLLTTQIRATTILFTAVYYVFCGFGITAGYHRLWAHRAYSASLPLQMFLAAGGAGSFQGSIFWWSRDHRVHHRYTDTERDPYNAHAGLWHSHVGWMLTRKDRRNLGYADVSDLKADPLVRFQHKYYPLIMVMFAFVIPTVFCGTVLGDWRGGFYYATMMRIVFLHHATFCVNSLAHYLGTATYDDRATPRDHIITAIVTLGEGYHNFHHEFPNDYRNAIRWYEYDPTKWFINACAALGAAFNLKMFTDNEIRRGWLWMREKELAAVRSKIDFGTPLESLPKFTEEEFLAQVKVHGKQWLIISGVVIDVEKFGDEHPGGKALIKSGIGKDMTEAFNGGVYDHHNSARNMLSRMRVGVMRKMD